MRISFSEQFKIPGDLMAAKPMREIDRLRAAMKVAVERYDWAQHDIMSEDHDLAAVETQVIQAHAAYARLHGSLSALPVC